MTIRRDAGWQSKDKKDKRLTIIAGAEHCVGTLTLLGERCERGEGIISMVPHGGVVTSNKDVLLFYGTWRAGAEGLCKPCPGIWAPNL